MASLQWHNFRSSDMMRPLPLEEIYRAYGAWSGIHDFNFDSLLNITSSTITGTVSGAYSTSAIVTGMPANFTAQYHVPDWGHGVSIVGGAVSLYLIVKENGDTFVGHNLLDVQQLIPEDNTPHEADVEVVFRQQTFDDTTGIVWRTVTLYLNGRWMTSYSDYTTAAYSNLTLGLIAFSYDIQSYTNVRVPELGDTAEFGTLDPGEFPLNGLQRTTEGRYLKNFLRFDGSLRAWKKKQRDAVLILSNTEGITRTFDLPQLVTHARMMGAYIWAEAIDRDHLRLYGHRFREVNNSMLLTQQECVEEAENTLKRSQEDTFSMRTQARHVPILEPEDRIEVDGESWIVKTYQFCQSGARAVQVYDCVRYVWGD